MRGILTDRSVLLVLGIAGGFFAAWAVLDRGPQIQLHATATQGVENFAIATGMIGAGVEGLYFLDFTTGDLKATVVNPKTGQFNSAFSHNILQDFGPIKNPKFLIVTGQANMPRGRAPFQYAQSIIYVAEVTSGQVMAYSVPWNSARQAAQQPQQGGFVALDSLRFRAIQDRNR